MLPPTATRAVARRVVNKVLIHRFGDHAFPRPRWRSS